MAAKEVRAGKAFVEIALRNKLQAGLKRAAAQLRAFASLTNAVGAGLVGASAGLLAPIAAAVADFTHFGSSMDDVAQRTGLSAAAVSELSHAASQSGTDVETLEKGIRRMQQTLVAAAGGSATANESLAALGLTVADLRGLSPDEQLAKLADGLSQLADPSVRTAAAMNLFGKSGAELLPMLASGAVGLAKMREQARSLGIAISNHDAQAAAALDDAFDVLTSTTKGLTRQIGAALAPALLGLTEQLAVGVATVTQFVRENRGLVTLSALAAIAVGAIGAALLGLGGVLTIASLAVGGLASAWGIAIATLQFLPKTFTRVTRTVSASLGSLVTSTQRTVRGWSTSWQQARQSFANWLSDIASRSGTISTALRPFVTSAIATGRRVGAALAIGIASVGPATQRVATTIASGLQRAANTVPTIWNSLRRSAAAFGRGFVGEVGLFTTRANAALWSFGSTTRAVFNRAVQYGQALRPLFTGVLSTVANRVVPAWAVVSQRLVAAAQGVGAQVTNTWTAARSRVAATMSAIGARVTATWRSVSGQVTTTIATAWGRVIATVAKSTERTRAAVSTAYSSLVATAGQPWQRVANVGEQVATRVASAWQRLPAWVRGPISQVATLLKHDSQRAVSFVGGAFRQLPAVAAAAWQRIRVAGTSAATTVASVTRSTMQRAFAATHAAGVAAFNGLRRAGAAAIGSVGKVGSRIGGAFSAVGGALTMLLPNVGGLIGTLLMGLPMVLSAVGAVGAALASLLNPVTLVVAVVAGGVAAWMKWSNSGQQAVATLRPAFAALQQVFAAVASIATRTFGGLSDAFAAGDLQLAAGVLWAGLKAAWYTGAAELEQVWPTLQSTAATVWNSIKSAGAQVVSHLGQQWSRLPQGLAAPLGIIGQSVGTVLGWIGGQLGALATAVGETFSGIATAIGQGEFSLAGEIAWTSIKLAFAQGTAWVTNLWAEFTTGLAMVWDGVVTSIRTAWSAAVTWIAKALLSVVGAVQSGLAKLAEWDPTGLVQKLNDAMAFDVQGSLQVLDNDQQRFARDQNQQRQQRDDERGADLLARQAATEQQLAELRKAREAALAKAHDLAAQDRPVADKANDAMAELNAAIAEAAKAKRLFDADQATADIGPVADNLDVTSKQIAAVGTFNPFAIQGLGADSLAQRTAVAAEGINQKMAQLLRKADHGGVQFA